MCSPFSFGDSLSWSWFTDFIFAFFVSAHIMSSPFAFGGSPFRTMFALSGLISKGEVLLKMAQRGDFGASPIWFGALPLHFGDLGSILASFLPFCGPFALILHLLHF